VVSLSGSEAFSGTVAPGPVLGCRTLRSALSGLLYRELHGLGLVHGPFSLRSRCVKDRLADGDTVRYSLNTVSPGLRRSVLLGTITCLTPLGESLISSGS
jgi:hypothetical protein